MKDRRRRDHRQDVRYALMMVVALIACYGAGKAYTTAKDLSANVHNQVGNREINVAHWCDAINQGRDFDRAFIHRVTRGHLTYSLGDLDCQQIERTTLASTKPHRGSPP